MDSKEFNTLIKEFELIHDQKGRPLEMHSLLVKDKETYLHHFRKEKEMSDVRSISKTVLTLVLGRVIQLSVEGKYSLINEETFIYPIIKNQFNLKNEENLEKIKRIKIKHLLTHTIGFEDVLMMREDIRDMDPFNYVNYILNYPLIYEPGDYYLYSNAGFYLLSVVLEEFIQEDLTQFLKREFFNLLGIKKFTWEKYGDYLAGATRLWLAPKDLLKIGELFLNNGKVKGKEFISEKWFEKMLRARIQTKGLEPSDWKFSRDSYGYGIWLADAGFYFAHGTAGQRLIVLPEKEKILITLAHQVNTEAMDKLLDKMIKEINKD